MKIQFAAAGLLLAWLAVGQAQTVPLPSQIQPGRLSDYEDPLRRLREAQGVQPGSPGGLLDNIQLDESARPKPENRAGALRFVLNSLKVIGNTVLDEKLIAAQLSAYIGQPVAGADLQEMAARITRLYAEQGYSTSRCIVPPQKVDDGNVVLQIEEDRLGVVALAGMTSYRFDSRYFFDQVNDLRGKVISVPQLQERLRLVARIPGARVKPVLRKSAFGVTDLVLEMSDIENLGTVSVSNDGSRLTGKERVSLAKTFNNLSGSGDVLSLSATASATSPQYFGGLNALYQRPVGSKGGRLNLSYSGLYYRLNPAAVGNNAIRYQGESSMFELNYEEPLPLPADYGNAVWFAGVENKSVAASTIYNTTFDHPAGFRYVDAHDRIFALTGGIKFEHFSDWLGQRGRTTGTLSVKKAIPGFFGSMTADTVSNKLDNLAAAATATTNASNAATALTNAAAVLAATSPSDGALYTTAITNYVRASALSTTAQAELAKYATVMGPIGDVRGMKPDFTKLYLGLSRAQGLPNSFLLDSSLAMEWTNARKLPQSYDFVGADNGPVGIRLSVALNRPIDGTGLVARAGITHIRAYSYYRDASGGGAPACQKTPGVYTATSIDRNTCTDTSPFYGLFYRDKRAFAELTYLPMLPAYAPNPNKLRFNVGLYW